MIADRRLARLESSSKKGFRVFGFWLSLLSQSYAASAFLLSRALGLGHVGFRAQGSGSYRCRR